MGSGILPEGPKISVGQSLQRWLASLIEYFELRIRLLGLESKEAGLHVLSLALLLVSTLTLFAGFLAMLVIFFLFLLTLLFGWPWGWSSLALGGGLLVLSIITTIIFRNRIAMPLFRASFAEFRKDREWLSGPNKRGG
jgi:uncharacterized membrane protein YqjE